MSHHHYETNPHFVQFPFQDQHPGGHSGPSSSWTAPHHDQIPQTHSIAPHHDQIPQTHSISPPGAKIKTRGRHQTEPPESVHESPSSRPLPLRPEDPLPPRHNPKSARPLLFSPQEQQTPHRGYGSESTPWRTAPTRPVHQPGPKRTKPITLPATICCAILLVVLIFTGLILLIVYLANRPRSPYFDISAATLNTANLNMGYDYVLNGDLAIVVNFTNPSKKSSVDFSYVMFELYFYNTLIATEHIEPFIVPKGMSMFTSFHLVSSQVPIQQIQSQELQLQLETGPVLLNLRGTFHARSNLGSLMRYSYWLHTHCSISLNTPPSGTMRARRCTTKR